MGQESLFPTRIQALQRQSSSEMPSRPSEGTAFLSGEGLSRKPRIQEKSLKSSVEESHSWRQASSVQWGPEVFPDIQRWHHRLRRFHMLKDVKLIRLQRGARAERQPIARKNHCRSFCEGFNPMVCRGLVGFQIRILVHFFWVGLLLSSLLSEASTTCEVLGQGWLPHVFAGSWP